MIDFTKHEKNTRGGDFPRTLYIHGYNGNPAGHTANAVRSFFGSERVIAPALDLLDFDGTMRTLRAVIAEQDIRIVAAHSTRSHCAVTKCLPSSQIRACCRQSRFPNSAA